ncbi:MAG: SDR family oxidoreductase [Parvibaculum sp.]
MNEMRAIFITGAAAGIGRATARHFIRRDWFVGLYDVDMVGLAQLSEELTAIHGGGSVTMGELDVTDPENFQQAVASFLSASGGRMDALFNCAGILKMGQFEEIDLTTHHKIIDINVNGVINGVDASLDALKATAKQFGDARVISMASASAVYGMPELAVYAASKHAVRALTEGFSIEFEQYGIQVSDVLPSYVDTGMVKNQEHKSHSLEQMGIAHSADDIAKLVWRAAHGEELHYFGTKQIGILDKLARIFPGYVRKRIKEASGF